MKKVFIFLAAISLSFMANAQTQQGYVKTKGRLDAQGNIIPGQGLKGATVSVQGRTTVLVNTDNGKFSFPVTTEQFRLDSVRKKGYQLVDIDACPRTYKYSTNPLYIVMETPELQLQDQLAAQRKIRRTLEKQLREREDEIETLMKQQKITDEEYRQALQKLYEYVDQNEQLVKDMVERYSKIDYDQLSEFDQKISELILNGELVKADSMLRTKGDINQRAADYQKHKAINAQERNKLSQQQEQLEQSEILAQKELEDLANDCYRKFEIFKMQHLNDSAEYYLDLRVGLDSTNVEWLSDAGDFILKYIADYDKALSYSQLALQQAIMQNGEHCEWVSDIYRDIGSEYTAQGDYGKALEYHSKALTIEESIFEKNHPKVALSNNGIGYVYFHQGNYDKALEYYNRALTIQKSIFGENHPDVAQSYNNIGAVYEELGNYSMALDYYTQALISYNYSLGESYPELAMCYSNIGGAYSHQGDYNKALEFRNKALDVAKMFFGEIHPHTALTYNNIGIEYYYLGDNEKALEYFIKATMIQKRIFGEYHPQIAISYNNIAVVHNELGDFDKALEFNERALAIRMAYYGESHPYVAYCYNNLGYTYDIQGNKGKALEYYNKALSVRIAAFGNEHPLVAATYNNIGAVYYDLGDFEKSLDNYNKALGIHEQIFGPDDPRTINIQERISEIESKLKEQENQPNE